MPFKNFGFSIFNIKNECISTFVSSCRVAESFKTSKPLEHNTENEEFEKSRVLQKYPLTHIILTTTTTTTTTTTIIIIITIIVSMITK